MDLYAIGPASHVYHIVVGERSYTTLCGLKVTALGVNVATKAAGLFLLYSKRAPNQRLCKHCERLKERESQDSAAS